MKLRALTSLALIGMLAAPIGCTPKQQADTKATVAQLAQYIPEVTVTVDTLSSVVAALAPQYAAAIAVAQPTFDVAQGQLAQLCAAYVASPSDGTLAGIRTTLNTMLSANADQLLATAKITDPNTVATVKLSIGAVRTVLLLMDGLMQKVSTPAQNAAAASARTMKLSACAPYLDQRRVELATGHRFGVVLDYEAAQGF